MPPALNQTSRVAIIGAGMAGLSCARQLTEKGLKPVVFEKSRGLGGRIATRRVDDFLSFDHGAQYVTARSDAFQSLIQSMKAAGAASLWCPNGGTASGGDWTVGAPGMSSLVKPLADGIEILRGTRVTGLQHEGSGWHVETDASGKMPAFDAVICTVPAPQARDLLAPCLPALAETLAGVSMAPCWTLMVDFDSRIEPGFDVRRDKAEDLSWIARNGSKPRRMNDRDAWVAQASPDWSAANLERDRDEIAPTMLEMLEKTLGIALPATGYLAAHRWRYALTTAPLGEPYLRSDDGTLYVGGDWCLGARVEYAFESGHAIADALNVSQVNEVPRRWFLGLR